MSKRNDKDNKLAGTVLETLKLAALATVAAAAGATAINEQRKGAYSLYVQAAHEAGSVSVLELASLALLKMIREKGAVGGQPLGCKQNKDGVTFIIPSAISSAKSVLTAALSHKVPVVEGENLRSFGDIRKDVQEINRKEREAKLSGVELVRVMGRKLAAELADLVEHEENAQDLEDLCARVNASMRDYGFVSEHDKVQDGAEELAEQGDDAAAAVIAAAPATPAKPARKAQGRNHRAHGPVAAQAE